MKWLAVLLVLTNVGAYLWLQRQESINVELDPNRFEGINLQQMTLKIFSRDPQQSEAVSADTITRIDLTQEITRELSFVAETPNKQAQETVLEPKREVLPKVEDIAETMRLPDIESEVDVVDERAMNSGLAQMASNSGEESQEAAKVPSQDSSETVINRFCYRVGPYIEQGSFDSAKALMQAQNIDHNITEPEVKSVVKAARVYLGPYDSDEDLQAERGKLKETKVEHYIVQIDGRPVLQLGYFSGLGRAESYTKRLKKVGFDVQMEKLYKQTTTDAWIYFQLSSEEQLADLQSLEYYRKVSIEKQACK